MAAEERDASSFQDVNRRVMDHIDKRIGPSGRDPPRRQALGADDDLEERHKEQEEQKKKILEDLASTDGMDEAERAKHERFLRAKQAAAVAADRQPAQPRSAIKPPAAATAEASSTKMRTQVSVGGTKYDEETGSRLEALAAQNNEKEQASHEKFLRAKEDALMQSYERTPVFDESTREAWQAMIEKKKKEKEGQVNPTSNNWISEEQYKEWGYPQHDPKFKDKEWHREQMELDRTDPRHNPNLLRDQDDPEFWNHAARKPFSKAMLRSEQHWNSRRKTWMKQYERVQLTNQKREEIAELLEDCSIETKRVLTPIMKYTITQTLLNDLLETAKQQRQPFNKVLEDQDTRESLENVRRKIDVGGEQAAETLMVEYDARWRSWADKLAAEKLKNDREERVIADTQTLAEVMNWGLKCKKDGLLEWEQGNVAEAHASWKQADDCLKQFKAADHEDEDNKTIYGLHISILKNLSQACIKLEYWTDAIEAADAATKLDPNDHKAWFRKACALEGVGKIEEAENCLKMVDDASVGRADRVRISKEVEVKREKYHSIKEREKKINNRMVGKALKNGVFASKREDMLENVPEEQAPPEFAQKEAELPLPPTPVVTPDEFARRTAANPAGLPVRETCARNKAAALPGTKAAAKSAGGGGYDLNGLDFSAEKKAKEKERMRRKLTREGAEDLLVELKEAYLDTGFQHQIFKLAMDVNRDKRDFMANLNKVALPLQSPILGKWGFEPSDKGVAEMKRAIQDWTYGVKKDSKIKLKADETTAALYGCMYDVCTRPDDAEVPEVDLAAWHARLNGTAHQTRESDDSDED